MAWKQLNAVVVGALVACVIGLFVRQQQLQDQWQREQQALWQLAGRSGGEGNSHSHVAERSLYFGPKVQKNYMSSDHLLFNALEYNFAMIADLDLESRLPNEFTWQSFLRHGTLRRTPQGTYDVVLQDPLPVHTHTATKNRSMELSELIMYRHRLLAACDYTGLIFKIVPGQSAVFQRYALADGNGDASKPFKSEWATVKDGVLWVGSVGKEWVKDGSVLHRNAEWVKAIHSSGRIENYDWGPVYQALRYATNTSYPGYLWHEAVHWDAWARRWVFMPRKASVDVPYSPEADQSRGTNLLIVASENFDSIQVRRLGDLNSEYGTTSVRKVPGSVDEFVALRVKEKDGVTHTEMSVFNLSGEFLLASGRQWMHVSATKYEGLTFVEM